MATDRDSGKLVVVLALPTVPGREQPTGNVVVNDDEVGRAVRAARVPGPKPRGQSRLPTGVVTKAVEVVAHQYQVNQLPYLTEKYVSSKVLHGAGRCALEYGVDSLYHGEC